MSKSGYLYCCLIGIYGTYRNGAKYSRNGNHVGTYLKAGGQRYADSYMRQHKEQVVRGLRKLRPRCLYE